MERSYSTWQGRLPQELRLAGIGSLEEANCFLRECYIEKFNQNFAVAATEKGTAFRKCGRRDLDWIFSIHTERVVSKDNTVAIGDRWWQIEKCRWKHTLAGQTVTVHQHLDGSVSIRYGPHLVGRYPEGGGNDGAVGSLEIASGDSHIPTARRRFPLSPNKKAKREA